MGTAGPGRQTTTPWFVAPLHENPVGQSSPVAHEVVHRPSSAPWLGETQIRDAQSRSREHRSPNPRSSPHADKAHATRNHDHFGVFIVGQSTCNAVAWHCFP